MQASSKTKKGRLLQSSRPRKNHYISFILLSHDRKHPTYPVCGQRGLLSSSGSFRATAATATNMPLWILQRMGHLETMASSLTLSNSKAEGFHPQHEWFHFGHKSPKHQVFIFQSIKKKRSNNKKRSGQQKPTKKGQPCIFLLVYFNDIFLIATLISPAGRAADRRPPWAFHWASS